LRASATEWLPLDASLALARNVKESAAALSFIGILLLAVVAVLPIGRRGGWAAWPLYTPLVTGFFAVLYESAQRGGWRFDLFLLYPAYSVIAGGWLFRMVRLQAHKPGKLPMEPA
jgi:hypothetical protein